MQNHTLHIKFNRGCDHFRYRKIREKKPQFLRGLTDHLRSQCQLVKSISNALEYTQNSAPDF